MLERMLVDTSTHVAWGQLSNKQKVQISIDLISEDFMSDGCFAESHEKAYEVMGTLVEEQVSNK